MTTPKLAKTCVVVGVGPGLGLALCRRFGREGFKVAMLARNQERLGEFHRTLADENIVADASGADVGDAESLLAALEDAEAKLGSPDVMIYNAAAFHPGALSSLGNQALARDLQANIVGALVATKQVLPAMVERNTGTLLFTGGGAGVTTWSTNASLSINKAALRMFALNLAEELRVTEIRAATVTVSGSIGKNEHFAPARIAQVYWKLHTGEEQQVEVVYT